MARDSATFHPARAKSAVRVSILTETWTTAIRLFRLAHDVQRVPRVPLGTLKQVVGIVVFESQNAI